MEISVVNVYGDCPLQTSDGGLEGSLRFHLEVGNHHVAVQSGQVDYWTKISCLFRNQEHPVVEPEKSHIADPLYGPLRQQGVHGLLEVLVAVPGPETDALMGELGSLKESYAHPILDSIGGSTGAQQTPPLWGKVCQASPHLDPVNGVQLRKLKEPS